MNGSTLISGAGILGPSTVWRVTHIGDYNGDGKADLMWRNTTDGSITMWLMSGGTTIGAAGLVGAGGWRVVP